MNVEHFQHSVWKHTESAILIPPWADASTVLDLVPIDNVVSWKTQIFSFFTVSERICYLRSDKYICEAISFLILLMFSPIVSIFTLKSVPLTSVEVSPTDFSRIYAMVHVDLKSWRFKVPDWTIFQKCLPGIRGSAIQKDMVLVSFDHAFNISNPSEFASNTYCQINPITC